MRVIIDFKIDIETLEAAICHCLIFNIKLSKKALLKEIKGAVWDKGNSLLQFPKYWGGDITRYSIKNNEKVDKLLRRYNDLIDM